MGKQKIDFVVTHETEITMSLDRIDKVALEGEQVLIFNGRRLDPNQPGIASWLWDETQVIIPKSHGFYEIFSEIERPFADIMNHYVWSTTVKISLEPHLWNWWLENYNFTLKNDAEKHRLINKLMKSGLGILDLIDYTFKREN